MLVNKSKEGRLTLIYLDNGATSRTDPEVIAVMVEVMKDVFANPSSLHRLGGKAERLVKQAREVMASLLQVSVNEIYFTSGGTEANNLAVKGIAFAYKQRGRHLITTQVEHPSVYEVCQQLEEWGWDITYVSVDGQGRVNPDDIERVITDQTVLVSVMHVNNETGTIQPIQEIGERLRSYPKVFFHVDAVQSFGKLPITPKQWNIDLLSLSGHKIHGPKGVGALYVRQGVQLSPLLVGGGQEQGLRSGTLNVPGIVGLAKASKLAIQKREEKAKEVSKWKQLFLERVMAQMDKVKINGDATPDGSSPYIINLSFPGLKSEVIVHALEQRDCYVSSKSACSSKLEKPSRVLLDMGLTPHEALGAIRISMGFDTIETELDKFAEILISVIPSLQKVVKG